MFERQSRFILIVLGSMGVVVWSCSRATDVPPAFRSTKEAPTKAGADGPPLQQDKQIHYMLAIYYIDEPKKEPLPELDVLIENAAVKFKRVDKISETPFPSVFVQFTNNRSDFDPPSKDLLSYFGRGITKAQANDIQQAKAVLMLGFAYDKEHVWSGLRSSLTMVEALARTTDGLIWDEETRELFTPDAWKERRIDDWTEEFPDVSKHIVLHAYKRDEFVRTISLGMVKFGLPDLVIEDSSWSQHQHVGLLVNLVAQRMAEGAPAKLPGDFDLELRAIKNKKVREPQLASIKPNATGIAPLAFREGSRDEGDPENRLIELAFDRSPGPDVHERQNYLLSSFLGSEDSAVTIRHDDELRAASEKARSKLPDLKKAFDAGLSPGEHILVKAPFQTRAGGREWMWVEVSSWHEQKIGGLLANDPVDVPDLRAGQVVNVNEADVFDYIHQRADGTADGNETGKVIQRQSQQK
jgi:uncharacterized protein YegJ (DUF2314 family)